MGKILYKLNEWKIDYKKILVLMICVLVSLTGCKNNNEKPIENNKTTEASVKDESSYLDEIIANFDVNKFDSKKFNGLVYKNDEVIDIKTIINDHYKENNFYLQYYMDGFEQLKKDSYTVIEKKDVLDSKANYYYDVLGEPSSICGIYYEWGNYEGPTGLIEFVWQYEDYSIRVSMSDYSKWTKGKPTSTRFLGATAYKNQNAKNEVPKSIGFWDKDRTVYEKKCVGIDLLNN